MSDTRATDATETTCVTVTLPTALVRELDARLVNGDATRDATIQRLIEDSLGEQDMRKASERFARFAQAERESEDELGWTTSPDMLAHLAEIPWESDAAPSGGRTSRPRGEPDPSS